MTDHDTPDDAIADSLLARAERGTARGADAVFDAAHERRPSASRVWMVAAAGLLVVVGGVIAVRTTRGGDATVSVGGTAPATSPAPGVTDPELPTTDVGGTAPPSVAITPGVTAPTDTIEGAIGTTPGTIVDGERTATTPPETDATATDPPAATTPSATSPTTPTTPATTQATDPGTSPPTTTADPSSSSTTTLVPEPEPIDPALLSTVGAIDAIWTVNADETVTVDITPLADTGTALWRSADVIEPIGDRMIVEFAVTASRVEYGSNAWAEIVLTTAERSTGQRRDALFATDVFPGHSTLGCRVTTDRTPTCVLMDDSAGGTRDGARVWQASFFEMAGTDSFGGFPSDDTDAAWRVCSEPGSPLRDCFDRFRLEVTSTSFTLYVNDVRYFEQTGLPELPPELFGEAYVYRASSQSRSQAPGLTFLWSAI